jgi:hypothetical protein
MKTTKEIVSKIATHLEEELDYLQGRWKDESEYEDFAEYEGCMKRKVDELGLSNVEFIKGTKRPFGFKFTVDGIEWSIYFKTKGRHYQLLSQCDGWDAIKTKFSNQVHSTIGLAYKELVTLGKVYTSGTKEYEKAFSQVIGQCNAHLAIIASKEGIFANVQPLTNAVGISFEFVGMMHEYKFDIENKVQVFKRLNNIMETNLEKLTGKHIDSLNEFLTTYNKNFFKINKEISEKIKPIEAIEIVEHKVEVYEKTFVEALHNYTTEICENDQILNAVQDEYWHADLSEFLAAYNKIFFKTNKEVFERTKPIRVAKHKEEVYEKTFAEALQNYTAEIRDFITKCKRNKMQTIECKSKIDFVENVVSSTIMVGDTELTPEQKKELEEKKYLEVPNVTGGPHPDRTALVVLTLNEKGVLKEEFRYPKEKQVLNNVAKSETPKSTQTLTKNKGIGINKVK